MTKKEKILDSLLSISNQLDRTILEEVSYGKVRPFCTRELKKIESFCKSLPFADEIDDLVKCAIAYSDEIESFGYAIDDLIVAIRCL